MNRRPANVETTITDDFDLGGITVHLTARNSSLLGDSVTVNISFATTEIVDFIFLFIPLM